MAGPKHLQVLIALLRALNPRGPGIPVAYRPARILSEEQCERRPVVLNEATVASR